LSTSGYFAVSHAGGAAVGVPAITRIPRSWQRSMTFRHQPKSCFPSAGSIRCHANSNSRTQVKPSSAMRSASRSHSASSQTSGYQLAPIRTSAGEKGGRSFMGAPSQESTRPVKGSGGRRP